MYVVVNKPEISSPVHTLAMQNQNQSTGRLRKIHHMQRKEQREERLALQPPNPGKNEPMDLIHSHLSFPSLEWLIMIAIPFQAGRTIRSFLLGLGVRSRSKGVDKRNGYIGLGLVVLVLGG